MMDELGQGWWQSEVSLALRERLLQQDRDAEALAERFFGPVDRNVPRFFGTSWKNIPYIPVTSSGFK